MVAAIFEARMSREQAERLAELMQEARPTRPEGVLTAALLVEGEAVQLIAFWKDRETLDRYLSTAAVPRGTELMRKVGAEPEMRIVDALELG
jgi:quinol monooxygenase YgiN